MPATWGEENSALLTSKELGTLSNLLLQMRADWLVVVNLSGFGY